FHGVTLLNQCTVGNREPVVQARQHEAERRAACEKGQRPHLLGLERPHALISREQSGALGDVVGDVLLKAPCVETSGDVIGEQIVASEVEIDQPRELAAKKKYVVGEKIAMDDPGGEISGPMALDLGKI